jgi:hypothetical protein
MSGIAGERYRPMSDQLTLVEFAVERRTDVQITKVSKLP